MRRQHVRFSSSLRPVLNYAKGMRRIKGPHEGNASNSSCGLLCALLAPLWRMALVTHPIPLTTIRSDLSTKTEFQSILERHGSGLTVL